MKKSLIIVAFTLGLFCIFSTVAWYYYEAPLERLLDSFWWLGSWVFGASLLFLPAKALFDKKP